MSLPTGTVTFLFTDVEGSTRLWEDDASAAGAALGRHDEIIESAAEQHAGAVVRPRGEGDSRFLVFARASDALAASLAIQSALAVESWPFERPLRVRIGINTGEADLRAGDYYGSAVNRCARIRGIAHGGQTLLSAATEHLIGDALPEKVSLLDLGEHRLRDVVEPERVFQVCHPDLPAEFPPLLSLDKRSNNLPSGLTSFVGRDPEVAEVKKRLGDARLLTLHGAAGCGKTRLALEVADELIGTYADGVWFVDLAPVADPTAVIEAIGGALGVSESGVGSVGASDDAGRGLRERVFDHLRARQLLLVLDNCEHVIAAVADLADDVLRLSPDVRILATSREALGIASESAWKVPSMSVPDPDDLPSLDELSRFEAFRLFVERARQRRGDFEVTAEDAPAIAQICRRLDGIPLAIELAAARTKLLSPTQIADRLDERFRLLVGGSRTALERQQTLRATVDWSYEPLTESERTLFSRLGVFAGGFSIDAVEAVCVGDDIADLDVLDLLAQLVDKSLVEADPHGDAVRYRMLETFRQYAREKLLERGEMAALRSAHRDHFLAFTERGSPHLWGDGQAAWVNRFDREHDNIRAALEWSTTDDPIKGARMVAATWPFWAIRGHITEGRAAAQAVMPALFDAEPGLRADVLRAVVVMAIQATDLQTAQMYLVDWMASARASGDPCRVGFASIGAGVADLIAGDLDAAAIRFEEAERIGREQGEAPLITYALVLRAELAGIGGRASESVALLEEARAIALPAGDLSTVASAAGSLSSAARAAGDYEKAERYLAECLEIARELGDRGQAGQALFGMGLAACARGDTARARALVDEGRGMQVETGGPKVWLALLGRIEEIDGNLDEAERLHRQVIEDAGSRGFPIPVAGSTMGLARVARARGEAAAGLSLARDALRAWAEFGARVVIADTLDILAGNLLDLGRAERAVVVFAAAASIRASQHEAVRPIDVPWLERDGEAARAALGEDAYEAARARGSAMSLEEAVAYALEDHPAARGG